MKADKEESSLKDVLDQLDTHISWHSMIRELICRMKEGDVR
jgi:hypothetical protein